MEAERCRGEAAGLDGQVNGAGEPPLRCCRARVDHNQEIH